jgi:hypothetical protein
MLMDQTMIKAENWYARACIWDGQRIKGKILFQKNPLPNMFCRIAG